MTAHSELVARLEGASEGSRELDREMALATGVLLTGIKENGEGCVKEGLWTQSLDAALALAERVLPGWMWNIAAETYGFDVEFFERCGDFWDGRGLVCAPTPALALCIAVLRAKEPQPDGEKT